MSKPDEFKVNNAAERLLCYSAAILCAKVSQPGNPYSVKAQIAGSILEAQQLIEAVYTAAG